jgi:hypothetical protein
MAWNLVNGYSPRSFSEILQEYVDEINSQFSTNYDTTTIVGTNFYKFGYTAIQLVMQAETKTAEITANLTDYIRTANEKINLPKSTISGFVAGLKAPVANGGLALNSTIKDITDPAEAGYMFLVVDVDSTAVDYATTKQQIIDKMASWLTVGLYYNGTETGTKMAVNGQTFTYKYALPSAVNTLVKITITASKNSTTPILNENQVRNIFNANFANLYKIGLDFEPEKYLEIARDCPFASNIVLEYSLDSGTTWLTVPKAMAYNEKIILTSPATIILN